MSATATKTDTIKDRLDNAVQYRSAIQQAKLGTMFTKLVEAKTFSASTTYALANKALFIQKITVVDSDTTDIIGDYIVGATKTSPKADTTLCAGVCTLGTDQKTLTFTASIKQITVTYLPSVDLSAAAVDNSKP